MYKVAQCVNSKSISSCNQVAYISLFIFPLKLGKTSQRILLKVCQNPRAMTLVVADRLTKSGKLYWAQTPLLLNSLVKEVVNLHGFPTTIVTKRKHLHELISEGALQVPGNLLRSKLRWLTNA